MKPKIFTLFTALTLSAGALFASDTAVGGIYYNFDATNLTATVTYRGSSSSAYDEYTGDVVIPATVTYGGNTYSVTSIGDAAFANCSGLTSVTIPNSVTSIGAWAFKGCSGLTSVTIPNSVTSIGDYAFSNCSGLTSVVWNAKNCADFAKYYDYSSRKYYYGPFCNIVSQITSFTFGSEVEHIPAYLCYGMENLTSVTIPNSATSIGDVAFWGCSGLTSVTIGNSVTSIGRSAFMYCYGLTSVTIPNSVTSIGDLAFYECSGLTKTNYTGDIAGWCGINFVGWYSNPTAYSHNLYINDVEVKDLVIPNSVTSIGNYAFSGCSGLTSVTIPNSVTSIGEEAFYNVPNIVYSGTATGSPWGARSVNGYVEGYLVYESEAKTQLLACFSAATGEIIIPNSVTSIGGYAFYGCSSLTSVTIPNSVTSIREGTFYDCYGLTSVTIPNSVTSIGDYAFRGCSGLTSVTIGNSVMSIGWAAFSGCSGLTAVVWNAKNCADFSSSEEAPFYNIASQITSFTFGSEVEHIPARLCDDMENLTSVTIPNSVTSIGDGAFSGCSSLTSVTIGNSVTSIEDYAFAECSGLTSITIPNSVTSIGEEAFYGCSSLTSVTIGNSVTSIGEEAFYGCTKLINIVCYAAEPPSCDASVFANYNVFLKVPCNNLMAYQTHVCWGSFKYISCIGSEEVQVTEFSVTPSTNEAQFTWPAEPNAATYELVISKDGVVFCTLTFNASGQLMGIAFAPGAGTAETTATSGFQFTVTGLDEASHYTYTFDAKDADGGVIQHYAGEFNTDGFVGLEQIELAGLYTQAGRIVCEGEFRIYDLLGRDVTRLNGSLSGVYVVKTANAAQKVVVK